MGDTRVSVAGFGLSGGVKRRALQGDAQITVDAARAKLPERAEPLLRWHGAQVGAGCSPAGTVC